MNKRLKSTKRTLAVPVILGLMASVIPIQAQLVAHWSFDTDVYTDVSGNGLNTSSTNAPTHTTANVAFGTGSADFGRANAEYLELASGINLSNESFTVSCWINRASLGGSHFVYAAGTTPHRGGYLHVGLNNNKISTDYYYDGWQSDVTIDDMNNWHHFLLTFDSAAQKQSIWLDGNLAEEDDTVGLLQNGLFTIGSREQTYTTYDGLMDEMWVFDNTLTSYEIADLYSANQFNSGTQSAYSILQLPGRIGAELYDNGGQSTAYVDSDPANNGNAAFRTTEGVDIETGDGDDNVVTDIQNEEWLEFTTTSIGAGLDMISLRVACTNANASVDFFVDNTFIGNVRLPHTGGLDVWDTITRSMLDIPQGSGQVVRLRFNGEGFKLNWFDASTEVQSPYTTHSLPGTIKAEDYDIGGTGAAYRDTTPGNSGDSTSRMEDVDISVADGGDVVSHITDGEWLEFTMNSIAADMISLSMRVASTNSNAAIDVYADLEYLGTFDVPDTGSLSTWQTVAASSTFLFPEGSDIQIRLEFIGGGFNLNSFSVASARAPYITHTIPGIIEAEHYDYGGEGEAFHDTTPENKGGAFRLNEAVDIESSGTGYSINYTDSGEWLEYTIENMPAGMSIVEFSLAGEEGTVGEVNLLIDGALVGSVDIPTTGWKFFEPRVLKGLTIPEGSNVVIRLETPQGGVNIDYFSISAPNTAFTETFLPGRIEFEDYDLGGQGIGFSDTTPTENKGNLDSYRTDNQADIHQADGGDGITVEYTEAGEWLSYTIADIPAGMDTMEFRLASPKSDGRYLTVYADGIFICQVDVPNTGGWQVYTNLVIEDLTIPTGVDIAIKIVNNTGAYNLNWFEVSGSGIEPSYSKWASSFRPDFIGSEADDYDEDGFDNLFEYALNGDPTDDMDGGGQTPILSNMGSNFLYIHQMRNDDTNLLYQVQTRVDMMYGDWLDTGSTVVGINETGTLYDEVTNSIPTVMDETFIRLKIEN